MRRKPRPFTITAGGLLVLLAAAAVAFRRSHDLELTVVLDRDRAFQGDAVMMTLKVENVSRRAIRLDKWDDVGPEQCLGATGLPLSLTLLSPPRPNPVMQLPPEEGRLAPLLPGEAMQLTCNVAELFSLIKPGKYALEARYFRDRWTRHAALALPGRFFSSLLIHDGVGVEILARSYDDPAKM